MAPSKQSKNRKSLPLDTSQATNDGEDSETSHIELLIRKKSAIKSKLSRLINYFNRVKTDNPNQATIIGIQTRLLDIEPQLLKDFTDIQFELEQLDSERFSEHELEQFELKYFQTVSEIKEFLVADSQVRSQGQVHAQSSTGGGFSQSLVPNSSMATRPVAKLPIIELPKFSGYFEKWLEFRDLYVSLVHDNNYISPIEKFQYLKASLEGSASHCIQSIPISSDNYSIAWDILCQRFENKKLMVHNHIKSLFNIFEVKGESSHNFRNIVDLVSKNIRSLQNLGLVTKDWDPLIIYLVTSKLDVDTIKEWEHTEFNDELPTLAELISFLSARADFFDKVSMHKGRPKKSFFGGRDHEKSSDGGETRGYSCYFCKEAHGIYKCTKFLALPIPKRVEKIKSLKLCLNCFHPGHKLEKCRSSKCKHCRQDHNSLLHPTDSSPIPTPRDSNAGQISMHNRVSQGQVLLATAMVQVCNPMGGFQRCRALLDSASMSNFISLECASQLSIPLNQINSSIVGIGQNHSSIKQSCEIKIKSCHSKFQTTINCLVLPQITSELPSSYFDSSSLNIPAHCNLADPTFNEPGSIDLLIGAEIFWNLVGDKRISLGPGKPVIQNSKLGWFISGPLGTSGSNNSICNFSRTTDIQTQLSKFWELEEISSKPILSEEEIQAEKHFSETVERDSDGRFIVSIPLKQSPEVLGESYNQALSQFLSLERKLARISKLREMYVEFMQEYQDLQHMTPFSSFPNQKLYYSPHHGVLREDSTTTKLRVVFNSSATSSSGISYNSLQMIGPVVQDDLVSIVMRFRQHQIVFAADVCKMYRQIQVKKEFRSLQLILWRSDPKDEIKTYSLNTVTYGTASAPFLATRCLKQLAIENETSNPLASQVIARDFYVDDILSGADSVEGAVQLCRNVSDILKTGCFELRKWKANNKEFLDQISLSNSDQEYFFGSSETSKILGMQWSSTSDEFSFRISLPPPMKQITKRLILSEVAKIYDPLGLVSPVIIKAKIILQRLWSQQLSWDEVVTGELAQCWSQLRSNLHELNSLNISRKIVCASPQSIQLHGFSDASNRAYGACIYIRSVDSNNAVHVHLLTSKTRVAPLKTISIPRLELCGALLLSQLYDKVKSCLTLNIDMSFFWCDSTVALAWLRCPPANLQVFVGNRVSTIQGLTPIKSWRHVPTEFNPADILSRGMSPRDLVSSSMWFYGPAWLKMSSDEWPADISEKKLLPIGELPEIRNTAYTFVETKPNGFPFVNFSSFPRINRAAAYVLRFVVNCNNKRKILEPKSGSLTVLELQNACNLLIKLAQTESFPVEQRDLKKTGFVSNKSRLISLTPFMDEKDIIRVGGRLKLSSYSFTTKHPAVLAQRHHFTTLIFRHEHKNLHHGGPQLLLSHIRQNYWPISGIDVAKRTVRECVICSRFNPKVYNPLMGNLPRVRTTPSLPFSNVGVDYAGPFSIKDRKGRGCKVSKCYIALFICLVTKAVHLEVVSDLSTASFLETFKRFIARRGKPFRVYSDNGTNFVGAHNQLLQLGTFLKENYSALQEKCGTSINIEWHFIPAYSPHHGGLWEAGVKSAKFHLKRVLSNVKFTFENFSTVVAEIEAILNSRPLTPLSSDPNDFTALTPGHFLIGRSLQSIPQPDFTSTPLNRLSHLEHLEHLKQHFWSRWSKEFVTQLQQRVKWKDHINNVTIGTLVLVRDDNLPPSKWRLGRVVEIHPGEDKIVRVVTVKTIFGTIKRSVTKICPLPVSPSEEETNVV